MGGIETLNEGLEVVVTGPLALSAQDSRTLLWLAKAGPYAVGSVRLHLEGSHVATIRDLQLASDNPRSRQAVTGKLLTHIAEYATDHGILKIKVHRNSRLDWVPKQLSRLGFHDGRGEGDRMLFYLDLYYKPSRRHRVPAAKAPTRASMAC